MKLTPFQRVLNSIVWIGSGILVIIVRVLIIQTASILVWEVLGGGMVAYGVARLVWAIFNRPSMDSEIPETKP